MSKDRAIVDPPLKIQGKKTKIVGHIIDEVDQLAIRDNFFADGGTWFEPFFGSGAVGFNVAPERAVFCDVNPFVVWLYRFICSGDLTGEQVAERLTGESLALAATGGDHYYRLRTEFNRKIKASEASTVAAALDFLTLNRTGFNGVIRFNGSGFYNVPFCRNPKRLTESLIQKVATAVDRVAAIARDRDWRFVVAGFEESFAMFAEDAAIVYADPPYVGTVNTYYGGAWGDLQQARLLEWLRTCERFILSLWYAKPEGVNPAAVELEADRRLTVKTFDHFYAVGPKVTNRMKVEECLIYNY